MSSALSLNFVNPEDLADCLRTFDGGVDALYKMLTEVWLVPPKSVTRSFQVHLQGVEETKVATEND